MLIKDLKQFRKDFGSIRETKLTKSGKSYTVVTVCTRTEFLSYMTLARYHRLVKVSRELGIDPLLGIVNIALIFGTNLMRTEFDDIESVLYGLRNQFN